MKKKDEKEVLKGFADRLKQIPNAPIQEVVPVKIENIPKELMIGFHVMLPEYLHKTLKVYSANKGISMKELVIEIIDKTVNQKLDDSE